MISSVWAQDGAALPANDMSALLSSALPFVLVFAVFYFVMLRPQMQEAKKHAALLAELKKGDVVMTDGGLVGEVASLKDGFVQLKLAEGVVVTVVRDSVKTTLTGDLAKNWQAKGGEPVAKKR